MREIKFRAWCGLSEKMLDDIDIEERTLRMLDGDNDQFYMQYTGLKDKNGKEIYEGDIVKTQNELFEKFIDVVKWESDLCGFRIDECHFFEDCEVIGNIYENPELINN